MKQKTASIFKPFLPLTRC